jgi:5-(carboxyamino)imidazole ribonucleotide synthase
MKAAVGILGGGQLGLMLAEAIDRLGFDSVIFERDPESPCGTKRAQVMTGEFENAASLKTFFSSVQHATFDSENVPLEALRPFAGQLIPSLRVLEISQHRGSEKKFLANLGAHPVAHRVVPPEEDIREAALAFGLPCIAKSALGGYDGKGQFRLTSEAQVAQVPLLAPGGWVLEEVLQLDCELSCLVARTESEEVCFPIFENLHAQHILDFTLLPARVDTTLQQEAKAVALNIARALQLKGLLTVEFFVGKGRDGRSRLYVNELAPRVHNSGHVTRQACSLSQFDALARVLTGTPVGGISINPGAYCMGQLLGEVWLAQGRSGGPLNLAALRHFPQILDVFLYGKREAREGRKMGHFVVREQSPEAALQVARAFRDALMNQS